MGDNTRDALRAFQSKQDLPATGTANPETLAKLEALLAA
jgi:peptidoglycan hydrolase-like protein with peptidoglycan-binding domain